MSGSFFTCLGVDACNTALGVLIFSALMNLGQSWFTVLAMFGCTCMTFFLFGSKMFTDWGFQQP